ncbi:MAG TPA: O-methyltransferase [Acidimicrobiia bacterium]|nr:O-methyltransferase [Acidimicrobiia bacterium]
MDMTADRWDYISDYIDEVFGGEDDILRSATAEADAAGLPPIAISASVGRLLMMLTRASGGSLAVELGTLGGYSGTWIARGLPENGRLITVEADEHHAEVAGRQFGRAGLAERVEIRRGRALDVLDDLASEVDESSVGLAFVDAEKVEYPEYARRLHALIAPGGFYVADNVLGTGGTWIGDLDHEGVAAIDAHNRLVASWPDFDSVIVPLRQGVLVARRR